ncbi:glutathione-regulated potassium-efflux system oxidoreductase KefF [Tatumella sp. UBA2305]|uniref:glutathione-regulated potassium-efflux system oxidoreductase KefF n=1 Tax=Tatumella sp. UBA2305 TaxID=1947647 RepID=UPI0025E956F5|nr:glutathione-regulated potassium-efflux system oxidoreductase KefF [Tatumella sp. UBA2305]
MILIIYAHPYPGYSHANRFMLEQVRDLPYVKIHSLYDNYPDFAIDIAREQQLLSEASLVILQHPMQWYSMPPLLKLWLDKVLTHGWAYGHNGRQLKGKSLMWAVTTGGNLNHFSLGDHPGFGVLTQPIQATALYCGMKWLPPFTVHNAFISDDNDLKQQAVQYRNRLEAWKEQNHG